jgi:uncharacterized protein (DUF983 family)
MNNEKKVRCPKCLGTGEFFNGFGIKKCKVCEDGKVLQDIAESYIYEKLPYE